MNRLLAIILAWVVVGTIIILAGVSLIPPISRWVDLVQEDVAIHHSVITSAFNKGMYIHDTRTDLCYFGSTYTGRIEFVHVACTDEVMGIAIEAPE